MLAAADATDGRITPDGLRWCIERCIEAGHIDALEVPGLKADRRAVLPGGLAILYTLATHFSIDALWPAKGALRQGVIVELHERLEGERRARPRDMREASVRELQTRFGVDLAQAERVRRTALSLFDTVMPAADTETRHDLTWACELHEVGLMVSHHDHHRHSAYLVAHVDAPGFSQSQQRRIGELVLGQRGGLRKVEPALSNEATAWQMLCLRLAYIRCHAREAADAEDFTLRRRGRDALLDFGTRWAELHPRTTYLLEEEAETWAKAGPLRLVLRAAG